MRLLVTGTEGYLGSLLAPTLLAEGHDVVGVDTGYYRNGWLYNGAPETVRTLTKDIRHLTVDDLGGPSALHRLKQEMLARINLALDPGRIDDVLFKEMLVQ